MVHQGEDQLFKYATKEDGFGLLKLLKESNANIKEIDFESENLTYNPTELVELDPKIYKTDMILELDHLIVLTEFQSTIVKTPDGKGEVEGLETLKEKVKVRIKDGEIFKIKKYDAKDITVLKDVAKEQSDTEEKEYQKELKELENLEKEDSKIKNNN